MRADRLRLVGLAGALCAGLAGLCLQAQAQTGTQTGTQPVPETQSTQPATQIPPQSFDEIVVGVRHDAAPFSFRLGSEPSDDLRNYGGYVVEICREVLELIVTESPFRGARITAREVGAGDRFSHLAPGGGIDLLCDPTSMTADRLGHYYVSMPVFLSGAAVAEQLRMPKSYYCGSMVGFVGNTTSEYPALAEFAAGQSFGRYGPAIARVLDLVGLNDDRGYDKDRLIAMQDEPLGKDPAFVKACVGKLTAPPVVKFDSHDEGLAALCRGEILFYVADVDIISSHIQKHLSECPVELNRNVLAIEQYGIFFKEIAHDLPPFDPGAVKNQYLYSAFNMALHRLSRQGESVLLRAFKDPTAFGDRPRTEILDRFFRMYTLGFR